MPGSFNGIGTKYYGEADWNADGSYQTTEWFVLAYVPIIPLKSLRIRRNEKGDLTVPLVYSRTGYFILEQKPLSWSQAFRTYLFILAYIVWCVVPLSLVKYIPTPSPAPGWMALLFVAAFVCLIAAPFIVLFRSRRRELMRAIAARKMT